jgi:hypothetical protein
MIDWHRMFGVTVVDLFVDSPFEVELEKELSRKRQFLDVVILRKGPGEIAEPLPDGLDNLAEHNLLTFKSFRQGLTSWAIDELLGHFVNYRKQVSPRRQRLLPIEQFRLYAVSTRDPTKLRSEVKLEKIQPGVYEAIWGTHRVRILVLNEMPEAAQNGAWEMFSDVAARAAAAALRYRPHTDDMNSVINELLNRYKAKGVDMSYTIENFRRDYAREYLHQLTPEERTEGLSPEELLRGRSADEVLRGLPPEERLRGLSAEEIQAYLRQLEQRSDRKPS